ncbi:50S ribosomal protein L17 [Candidatus Saccharibacteria bacterium 32-45-3]|nr:MAG: 50S ribosomal protein L17 [Candidatus Saccharibacteria bacterium 32-45-3]
MHRHGYKGRKFGRETDQRRALLRGLASSLIEYGSIETTLPKAKEVVPYVERLITKAKRGDLANRRHVIAGLSTVKLGNKLVDEIAPKLTGRVSGHLRIKRTRARVGDNAELARISFVDDITTTEENPVEIVATPSKATKAVAAKKPVAKAKTDKESK